MFVSIINSMLRITSSLYSLLTWLLRYFFGVPLQSLEPIRDWSGLTEEMLAEIAMRMPSVEDFMAFRGVCTSWRAAARLDKFVNSRSGSRVPFLMIAGQQENNDEYCELYSLSRRRIAMRLKLPEVKGKRCMEAGFGWLLTVASCSGEVNLLNPLTRSQIHLPNLPGSVDCIFILTAALSANPSTTCNFVLMAIRNAGQFLGYWKPGNLTWTPIKTSGRIFSDVAYYNGKFYVLDAIDELWVWDDVAVTHLHLDNIGHDLVFSAKEAYLVESSNGELLVVIRKSRDEFRVVRLDVRNCQWEEMTSLGKDAVFVGHSVSKSIVASAFPSGIKPNCIYFTEEGMQFRLCYELASAGRGGEDMELYNLIVSGRGGEDDMGVYNLGDGNIDRFRGITSVSNFICPPVWISF
ncbi:OLC1v1028930C1 [Oldenlandia corymbosa var. corymbosa]|uniref:OLC1v1028930C1 n=1 Tax=Oldenlandia corymbosa var. corymbosa TaxID=529605 RepID=A0AAV1CFQ0_OLDCO|nr:OLC1v1028930C1 [Oldenlandia corymbosa var. corymbosa]